MFEEEPVRVGVPGCRPADRTTAQAPLTVRVGFYDDSGTAALPPGVLGPPARSPLAAVRS
jgi:hypothetical protein